jgi:regulator of nonsense transcripts 1
MRRWEDEEIDFEALPSSRKVIVEQDSDAENKDDSDVSSEFGLDKLALSENEEEEDIIHYEHECKYCGRHETDSVAKCLGCQRWFCNSMSTSTGSHLVQHLVRARHKEIALHPDSPIGDAILECYNCGCRNIFLLGFIPAKADAVVVLLCRQPCASGASGDGDWDLESWEPLISNRAILSWLLRSPTDGGRRISTEQIMRLEEVWKKRPDATVDDMLLPEAEEDISPVQLTYRDAYDYQSIMGPLIGLEAEYDKNMKESQKESGVSVRWDVGLNQNRLAFFTLPRSAEEFRIALGDEVIIRLDAKPSWSVQGVIIRSPSRLATEEICVEIRRQRNKMIPEEYSTGYSIEFVWKSTSYDRMQLALKQLAIDESCVDGTIFSLLMGHQGVEQPMLKVPVPAELSAPGLPLLNHSQAHAVKTVLTRPLSLIQGPPGTGKTVTSASIVYHLASLNQGPILVVAPSNVAVDHLTEKIHKTGLRVVRIAAKCREDVSSAVSFLALHEQVKNIPSSGSVELAKLIQLKEDRGELSAKDEQRYLKLLRASEQAILKAAQIICCTCVGAGDARLKGYRFRAVILDEATQAVEPEALIPIVHHTKQLVLIGDHRQLGPVILNKAAVKAGLNQSLFERLILLGLRPIRLQVQYRMHPCLSEFPSNHFYEGSLQNGVTAAERQRRSLDFPWPSLTSPMFFLSTGGSEEISSSGTSYLNRAEASHVEKIVTRLLKCAILPSQIGVITPYDGQRAFIQQLMQLSGPLRKDMYAEVEVASVDAFQGREKDYIILSCVRSNDHQGIGFLSDPRRLNVALTRAKYGLVVLGNPRVLGKDPLWYSLIRHFQSKSLLMEGTNLAALRPSMLHLPAPRQSNRGPTHALVDGRQFHAAVPPFSTGLTADSLKMGATFELPFHSLTKQSFQSHMLTQDNPEDD